MNDKTKIVRTEEASISFIILHYCIEVPLCTLHTILDELYFMRIIKKKTKHKRWVRE